MWNVFKREKCFLMGKWTRGGDKGEMRESERGQSMDPTLSVFQLVGRTMFYS